MQLRTNHGITQACLERRFVREIKILSRISVPGTSMVSVLSVVVVVQWQNVSLDLAARATVLQAFLFD
jgi:hypothetical protein